MNKAELQFRRNLCNQMTGKWLVTIHVESHLNPGVPDLSYVMAGDNHETGWLELKVIKWNVQNTTRVQIEPGQHAWMRDHSRRIPAHFLITDEETCWVISGKHYASLGLLPLSKDELKALAASTFAIKELPLKLSLVLAAETRRDRYEP